LQKHKNRMHSNTTSEHKQDETVKFTSPLL